VIGRNIAGRAHELQRRLERHRPTGILHRHSALRLSAHPLISVRQPAPNRYDYLADCRRAEKLSAYSPRREL
jgi:hypothetical protein